MNPRLSTPRRWLALLAAATFVAACGGSGSDAASESAAPEGDAAIASVSGTITGFGSVIIDGKRFDDSLASVAVDQGATTAATATLGDLKLGMSVDARLEGGRLLDVVVRAKLDGPVATIDLAGSSFTVYGQTVKVLTTGATPTLFEGVTNLAGLAVNDRVEVHGTVDANRALNATRVERKPLSEAPPAVRIGGVVTLLNASAKTFRFNDLTVDFNTAVITPAGAVPADGRLVVAFGDNAPAAGRFVAKALRIVGAGEGEGFGIGGRIGTFTSIADFTVSGVRVDASSAVLEGGVATDLAAGVAVAVEGRVLNGVLKASKLRIIKTSTDALASLAGQVADFVSVASFKVRETPVDASTATFVNGTSADLGNGAQVIVVGKAQGDLFKADRVEFVRPPAAQPVRLLGEVRDWSADLRTLRLMGMTVRLGNAVEFVGGTVAQMVNGRRIELAGMPDANGVVVATRIAFLGELAPVRASVAGGRISDAATGTFKLPGGLTVTYSQQTVIEGGTSANLANGVAVLVMGSVNAGTRTLAATWMQIVPAEGGGPRIAGAIGTFTSSADFKIGEQKIDASGASFQGGEPADLASGSVVIASGPMVERAGVRVLVAERLRILLK